MTTPFAADLTDLTLEDAQAIEARHEHDPNIRVYGTGIKATVFLDKISGHRARIEDWTGSHRHTTVHTLMWDTEAVYDADGPSFITSETMRKS